MNKKNLKLVSAALLATLTMGTTFTGCKDYDDDINNLQEQITANTNAIKKINDLIASGSVITKVEKDSVKGSVKVTLSNGDSFELTNGANGAAGKDADVWEIKDGFWYKNGVDQGIKAEGKDGLDGKPGADGADGKDGLDGNPGADGKDGAIYRPNTETGNFDKVTWDAEGNEVVEPTTISWKAAGISAVLTGTDLILSGVEGAEGTVTISLSLDLRGFTFMPDYTIYGEPLMLYPIFDYNALSVAKADSKDEAWDEGETSKSINNGMIAKYKVTPSNAKEADLKNLSYDIIAPTDIAFTRAESPVQANFKEFANGQLSVDVKFSDAFTKLVGDNREDDKLTQIALQATVGEEVITSTQYVTVFPDTIGNFELAKPMPKKEDDYHYRTAINEEQPEAGNIHEAWEGREDSYDLTMVYGKTINLFDYVETHNTTDDACTKVNIEDFGLNYKFELVKNYKLGTPETDQADFIDATDIANGNITSKVYSKDGIAAVGRTPIIRVKLMDGTAVVKVAYIKILITDKEILPIDPIEITVADKLKFDCTEAATAAITVKQMNEEVYLAAGMSKAAFHAAYTFNDTDADKNDGVVATEEQVEGDETTYVVKFSMTSDDVWANSGKTIKHTVTYKGANLPDVVITFTINVEDITKTASVKTADMLKNIWSADYSYAKFNVAVPTTPTDNDEANCKFKNDLNYPFVTEGGIIKGFDNVTYTFAKENENSALVVGKYTVKVTLADDNMTLKAQILKVNGVAVTKPSEVVAIIANDATTNTVVYAETETALELLNTNAMFAYVGATTMPCKDDAEKVITIDFNGKDYFQANFIRPINVAGIAAGEFVDGVDLGSVGSYVALEDLVALTDWRKLEFAKNAHFYGFYGVKDNGINVIIPNVKTTINGDPILLSSTNTQFFVKSAAEMSEEYETLKDGDTSKFTSNFGYIVYFNGTATVNAAYTLTVPVTVEYKWGTTDEVEVTVNVVKTIGQAKKN